MTSLSPFSETPISNLVPVSRAIHVAQKRCSIFGSDAFHISLLSHRKELKISPLYMSASKV